jgi:hypothetical protein
LTEGRAVQFWIGIIGGLFVGAGVGAIMMAWFAAGKHADLQEQLDAWEATRWPGPPR